MLHGNDRLFGNWLDEGRKVEACSISLRGTLAIALSQGALSRSENTQSRELASECGAILFDEKTVISHNEVSAILNIRRGKRGLEPLDDYRVLLLSGDIVTEECHEVFEVEEPRKYLHYASLLERGYHTKGIEKMGDRRSVQEIVNANHSKNIRAGVTIHSTRGSWSSWPPHEFEIEAMRSPAKKPFNGKFAEVFGYMTEPRSSWGLQVMVDGINKGTEPKVEVIQDGNIFSIPCGSHPVVASPGITMAYIWVYAAIPGHEKF